MNKFSKREACEYNTYRRIMQWLICRICITGYFKLMYKYKLTGTKNIPKHERFIVAANHISGKDPFIVAGMFDKGIAFMAKEELFENFFSRLLMDLCGAFAVKRDKVAVSTIKTALSISQTDWMLGLFPQGTRDPSEKVEKITRGFASFAKATKTGILPVAITGTDKKAKWPFCSEINVMVGKMIPYSEDIDEMMHQWCAAISEMTGKEYKLAD